MRAQPQKMGPGAAVSTDLPHCAVGLSRMNATSHHVATAPGQQVSDNHRPHPKKMWGAIQKELEMMLTLRVVEESQSD